MKKNAGIYARVSSKKQKEGDTIDSQVDALHVYANQEGYYVPKEWVFLDEGVSGSTLQRSALDELRNAIRLECIETIFIYAPDRLSRQYTHQLILLEEFRKHGVKVNFLKDTPTGNTPEAVMFNHLQGIIAEYERAQILDRSRRGRLYKAKQGDPAILPDVAYGYKKVKNGRTTIVELVEPQAEVVKKIFTLYVHKKMPLIAIENLLTSEGIKSPSGLPKWDRSTIRDILKNHSYTGTAYFGKTEKGEGNNGKIRYCHSGKFVGPKYVKKKLPEERWLPINVPQIISENDFELAQEQIKKNQVLASRNTKEPGLLQGLVICGECGNPCYKRFRRYKNENKGYYYCKSHTDKRLTKCSNGWIRQPELDDLVYNEVVKFLRNPSIIQEELSRRAQQAGGNEEIERKEIMLRKELFKMTQERNRLLDGFQSGLIDLKELTKRNQGVDVRRGSLDKELKAIQAIKLEKMKEITLEHVFEHILINMKKSSTELSLMEKQKLVRLLVEKVVVQNDEIKIIHCISPQVLSQEICHLSGGDPT